MRVKLFLLFALVLTGAILMAQPQSETSTVGNVFFVKLGNGLNGIIEPVDGATNTELTLIVKAGSAYEGDSLTGISYVIQNILATKINLHLKNNANEISYQNAGFTWQCTSEQSIYRFTLGSEKLNALCALLRDSVMSAKITPQDLGAARITVLQQLENDKHDPEKIFEDKIRKALYKQDHAKLEVKGRAELVKDFDYDLLMDFYKKYYVPNNALVTATGKLVNTDVQKALETNLSQLIKGAFNPETVNKFRVFHPMTYTTQFVQEDTTSNPEFQICWQFPGLVSNPKAAYSAFLLTALLNDRNNFIQIKAARMGCRKFLIQYEANNFNGVFKITMQPSKKNFLETYQFVIREMNRLQETLLNPEMINAARLQVKFEYGYREKGKEHAAQIAKYWVFNDETIYLALLDSMMHVTDKALKNFTVDYFNQSPHVTGLLISKTDRQDLHVDSVFTDLDENVSKYVFKYRQNITDLEGEDNKTMLRNLLQWLTINSDVSVQVNGFSDEHEYNKTTDDSIIQFLDSLPSFNKTMPNIVKKGYLRPEMMRSVKIIKYLYDHGIEAERLSGTSMMFKSANSQEADDNQKCTLTLNKYHKSPSLYEYHYGRKPDKKE